MGLLYAVCKRELAFGSDTLTELAGGVAGLIESSLISLSEEAGAGRLGFVVDVVEDCTYVLGRVFVGVTGFPACVDEVGDLLWKLSLKAGLRAPTGVEVLAQARVVKTLGCAGHYQDKCNLSLSGRVRAQQR